MTQHARQADKRTRYRLQIVNTCPLVRLNIHTQKIALTSRQIERISGTDANSRRLDRLPVNHRERSALQALTDRPDCQPLTLTLESPGRQQARND